MNYDSYSHISRTDSLQLRQWARGCFAKPLREQGFVCYPGADTSWYRLVDGQLLQSVYLYGVVSKQATNVKIGYGMHPLFIEAPLPQRLQVQDWIDSEIMTQIHFFPPLTAVEEYGGLMLPLTPQRGAEKLREFIFPLFEQSKTVEKAYAWYKARYLAMETAVRSYATPEFIDWAIYMDDRKLYPMCLRALEQKKEPLAPECAEKRAAQIEAMRNGLRDEYVKRLEAEKAENAKRLRKILETSAP